MRIACLQFAPQVGDIDNNLNRADSVLAKANPDDLENLDLLVLPELAFTGYNFKSLNQISPFLEPQGSGISALWARTTALKYNTNVVVGYPERVDVTPKWPTGPEYYNSTIVVNGDGETVANYRKSFLYVIDETWALEGKDGFFVEDVPDLGTIAMGICMDLNPYKFEAPWHAFEFAFHILSVEANLVIVTMAWVTREDGRHFSRMPEEPDMETLTYWVQRLEPLIRIDGQEEVIVVFCNRTGTEDDLVYAGTSSVIGIQDGEVNVYGILGRSVKDVLVVDTDNGPFAKLVQRSDVDDENSSQVLGGRRMGRNHSRADSTTKNTEQKAKTHSTGGQRRPSPTPGLPSKSRRTKPESPKIKIPETQPFPQQLASYKFPLDESPGVATPTCPSPTPLDQRPKLTSPSPKPPHHQIDTPYPRDDLTQDRPHIYGGHVSVDPAASQSNSPSSGLLPDKYFRFTSQRPLRSPMESRFPQVYPPASPAMSSPVASSLVSIQSKGTTGGRSISGSKRQSPAPTTSQRKKTEASLHGSENTKSDSKGDENQKALPPRPSSPKSRNASRTGRPTYDRRTSEPQQPNLSELGQRLESISRRPGSAMDSKSNDSDASRQGRARARQASNAGRVGTPLSGDENIGRVPSKDTRFTESPVVMGEEIVRSQSDLFKNRGQNFSRAATGSVQTWADARSRSRSGSTSLMNRDAQPHIEPDETRTLVWGELSKMVGEVLSHPREASRGRGQEPMPLSPPVPVASTATRSRSDGLPEGPRVEQRLLSRDRGGSTDPKPMRTIMAPDGAKASLDPDDEIVAEIIFHSHAQKHNQGQASNPTSPEITQEGSSRQDKNTGSRERSRNNTPQTFRKGSMPPTTVEKKRSSPQNSFGEIRVYKETTPSNAKGRPDSGDSCPNMDGASVHTITSPVRSPLTPSPRVFEPKTPKAMKLDSDFGLLTSFSDHLPSEEFLPLDSIDGDSKDTRYPKAKSTGW
ncbi:hypothetical protein N0V93_006413 [Gnomoniopsis smithogilvyi]|uniref:CN hydrolase domain-containing protein n=1 Tax=Gnomoniopsis smithogilvyi TaxID=1191159 RepID=A0A9W8YPK8_9PEZI|nr:hypothetical protein N0V93_006413 [Gnomoniopsis smithogilvyi]